MPHHNKVAHSNTIFACKFINNIAKQINAPHLPVRIIPDEHVLLPKHDTTALKRLKRSQHTMAAPQQSPPRKVANLEIDMFFAIFFFFVFNFDPLGGPRDFFVVGARSIATDSFENES